MGIALPAGGFTDRDQRLFTLVASLVAQSLSTANAFEAMREASLVEPLTGCATRAEGARRFEAELRRAHRAGTSVAVLMLDLDHFKNINDLFGHKAGDAVLSASGDTLLTTLRASDVRCRWGGEECLLVLPDSNVEQARRAISCGAVSPKYPSGRRSCPPRDGQHRTHAQRAEQNRYPAADRAPTLPLCATCQGSSAELRQDHAARIRLLRRVVEPRADTAASERVAADPRGVETVRSAVRGPEWNGTERRNAQRGDRRRMPGAGRRARTAPTRSDLANANR